MTEGTLNLNVWGYIVAALLLTHITIAAVTIFLHRHQAHRALTLHPVISHFFRGWLWLTTGMVTQQWVAIHRKHHAKCETNQDPHSPQVLGIKKVLWQGAELYKKESVNQETVEKYGQGTPDDWLERYIYGKYPTVGVTLMLLIDLYCFGLAGIAIWAIQMMWIPFWAAGVINGIGHYWGYRNYECKDASRNIIPWGILIGGEELHNNHHTYASSAKLSSKPWEFDIGWMYIKLMEIFKLAQVKRIAPKAIHRYHMPTMDMDTFRNFVADRFQIMAKYGKDVIAEVNKQELLQAGLTDKGILKRAKQLLIRDEHAMSTEAKQKLTRLLDQNQSLKTVYQFKQQLQDIWNHAAGCPEQLLILLREWCKQAEATGIKALQDFAQSLRCYPLQPAH